MNSAEISARKKRCLKISGITTLIVVVIAAIIAGVIIGRVNNADGRVEGLEADSPTIRDLVPTTTEELTNAGLDTLTDIVRLDDEEEPDISLDSTNLTTETINIPLPEDGEISEE